MFICLYEVDYLMIVLAVSVVGRIRQYVCIRLIAIEKFMEIVEVGRGGEQFWQLRL